MLKEFKLALLFLIIAIALTFAQVLNASEKTYLYDNGAWQFNKTGSQEYTLYIHNRFMDPGYYYDLEKQLSVLLPTDTLVIDIKSDGGSADGLEYIISTIRATNKKEVIAHVTGPSYSSAAFLSCYADKLNIDNGAFIMFHAGTLTLDSYGYTSKELINMALQFEDRVRNISNECVRKNIITAADVESMINNNMELYKYSNGNVFKNYR